MIFLAYLKLKEKLVYYRHTYNFPSYCQEIMYLCGIMLYQVSVLCDYKCWLQF